MIVDNHTKLQKMSLYTSNSRPLSNTKPNRVDSQSTPGHNVVLTEPEVSEGDPLTDTKELITII